MLEFSDIFLSQNILLLAPQIIFQKTTPFHKYLFDHYQAHKYQSPNPAQKSCLFVTQI